MSDFEINPIDVADHEGDSPTPTPEVHTHRMLSRYQELTLDAAWTAVEPLVVQRAGDWCMLSGRVTRLTSVLNTNMALATVSAQYKPAFTSWSPVAILTTKKGAATHGSALLVADINGNLSIYDSNGGASTFLDVFIVGVNWRLV